MKYFVHIFLKRDIRYIYVYDVYLYLFVNNFASLIVGSWPNKSKDKFIGLLCRKAGFFRNPTKEPDFLKPQKNPPCGKFRAITHPHCMRRIYIFRQKKKLTFSSCGIWIFHQDHLEWYGSSDNCELSQNALCSPATLYLSSD